LTERRVLETRSAQEYGTYGDLPCGKAETRDIPFVVADPPVFPPWNKSGNQFKIAMPFTVQCTPFFTVRAKGGEKTSVKSDRALAHRTEYICKPGNQTFESLNWITAEFLTFTLPGVVEPVKLGARISHYPADFLPYKCSDARLQRLLVKCQRTIRVCMRDSMFDCPDRERCMYSADYGDAAMVRYALTSPA
jgi:hypothetical protein